MENLPVEVIGIILSHVASARDIVIASLTCKKWRHAWHNHLLTLSFDTIDWPLYRQICSTQLEMLITCTIFQTKGLQSLTILMNYDHQFCVTTVISWLKYTSDSLRQLRFYVRTSPTFNIIDKCNRQRLEVLALADNPISRVVPSYHKFPCLKGLSLSSVTISALDLSLLLSACPKLEVLNIFCPEITMLDSQASIELSSSSLKVLLVESFNFDKFVLQADSLECLDLKDCNFDVFELIGKDTLKVLRIDDVSINHLDIGDSTENLEIVDVCNFTIMWPKFYHIISKASKLNRLRLWDVVFDDEDEVVDIETISVCFSRLTYLSLSYDLKDGVLHYGLQGLSFLMNVVVLELGWNKISDLFSVWVVGLLEGCPNLKKLVIYGFVAEVRTHEECQTFARFSEFMLLLGRKHSHIKFEFQYE
ncbi:F-box/LRR-repeat protein At1g67190-like [Cicer arietinum]|uniref:F-box/LRR-repeat protein At1g67190-like n=1 Tax=Cicer arietinum TaxID=3827 RepID=A0A3Q7XW27_CICAR|nr:F-box/LRR-repeat protein At1g67190-like [Cicer arietinum]